MNMYWNSLDVSFGKFMVWNEKSMLFNLYYTQLMFVNCAYFQNAQVVCISLYRMLFWGNVTYFIKMLVFQIFDLFVVKNVVQFSKRKKKFKNHLEFW